MLNLGHVPWPNNTYAITLCSCLNCITMIHVENFFTTKMIVWEEIANLLACSVFPVPRRKYVYDCFQFSTRRQLYSVFKALVHGSTTYLCLDPYTLAWSSRLSYIIILNECVDRRQKNKGILFLTCRFSVPQAWRKTWSTGSWRFRAAVVSRGQAVMKTVSICTSLPSSVPGPWRFWAAVVSRGQAVMKTVSICTSVPSSMPGPALPERGINPSIVKDKDIIYNFGLCNLKISLWFQSGEETLSSHFINNMIL